MLETKVDDNKIELILQSADKAQRKGKLEKALEGYHKVFQINKISKLEKKILDLEETIIKKRFANEYKILSDDHDFSNFLNLCNKLEKENFILWPLKRKAFYFMVKEKEEDAFKIFSEFTYFTDNEKIDFGRLLLQKGCSLKTLILWQSILVNDDKNILTSADCSNLKTHLRLVLKGNYNIKNLSNLNHKGLTWIYKNLDKEEYLKILISYLKYLQLKTLWQEGFIFINKTISRVDSNLLDNIEIYLIYSQFAFWTTCLKNKILDEDEKNLKEILSNNKIIQGLKLKKTEATKFKIQMLNFIDFLKNKDKGGAEFNDIISINPYLILDLKEDIAKKELMIRVAQKLKENKLSPSIIQKAQKLYLNDEYKYLIKFLYDFPIQKF